jgi:hypothetical protein
MHIYDHEYGFWEFVHSDEEAHAFIHMHVKAQAWVRDRARELRANANTATHVCSVELIGAHAASGHDRNRSRRACAYAQEHLDPHDAATWRRQISARSDAWKTRMPAHAVP